MSLFVDEADVVDNDTQQGLFRDLVQGQRQARVFLISDERIGSGKTTLLRRLAWNCRWRAEGRRPVLCKVDLEHREDLTEYNLISLIGRELLADAGDDADRYLPEFARLEAALANRNPVPFADPGGADVGGNLGWVDARDARIEGGTVAGMVVHAPAAGTLNVFVPERRAPEWHEELRPAAQQKIISAFFSDLRKLTCDQLAVIFIDSVDEKAGSLTLRDWVLKTLLEKVFLDPQRKPPNAILCLAGRSFPDYRKRLLENFETLVAAPQLLSDWQRNHTEGLLWLAAKVHVSEKIIDALHEGIVKNRIPLDRALQGALLMGLEGQR